MSLYKWFANGNERQVAPRSVASCRCSPLLATYCRSLPDRGGEFKSPLRHTNKCSILFPEPEDQPGQWVARNRLVVEQLALNEDVAVGGRTHLDAAPNGGQAGEAECCRRCLGGERRPAIEVPLATQ